MNKKELNKKKKGKANNKKKKQNDKIAKEWGKYTKRIKEKDKAFWF